mmetsp:Transcript_43389/g.77669  ORF Transcript_43389/g.77669 Transcript_43389/m.77669 type:complete len:168 (+) Transcript_43389:265-768(+)
MPQPRQPGCEDPQCLPFVPTPDVRSLRSESLARSNRSPGVMRGNKSVVLLAILAMLMCDAPYCGVLVAAQIPTEASTGTETRREKQSEVLESLGRWATSTMLPCSLAYYRSNPSLASIGEASEVGELPLCQLADLFFWGFSCTEGNVTGVCVVICHSRPPPSITRHQ